MKDYEIDRVLAEDEILPSSGFAASVMEAVRREAPETGGIPFPWKRAVPGLVLCVSICVVTVLVCLLDPERLAGPQTANLRWINELGRNAGVLLERAEWRPIGLALLVTLFSLIPLRAAFRKTEF
jgi:hypothetical protein